MLLVQEVTGPARARIGQSITYRVTAFNRGDVSDEEAAAVHWLVKSSAGAALLSRRDVGPRLELDVPDTWAGRDVLVMPYMRSPSMSIVAQTRISAGTPSIDGVRSVQCVRERNRYYATVDDQPRFYVGSDVSYSGRRGLMNSSNPPGPRYEAEDYQAAQGDWAWYLQPTISVESGRYFTCLNTYDRAAFTFGHIQLAAHTPDENFVLILREMLALPLASAYFPELTVQGGRVHRRTSNGLRPLESSSSTRELMAYFNPNGDRVDPIEAERAARMVDWCVCDPAFRDLQVDFAVRQQRRKLAYYATKLPLDGVVDKLCIVVLDILHQGRARFSSIKSALTANDPFDSLLGLGASTYKARITGLRAGIRTLEERGKVGHKVYDRASGEFVVPNGA